MAFTLHDDTVVGENAVLAIQSQYRSYFDDYWYETDVIYWDGTTFRRQTIDASKPHKVDASKELYEDYRTFIFKKNYDKFFAKAQEESMNIEKGCVVEVVRGRKVPKGIQGKVVGFTVKESQWGVETRVGIATSDVMVEVERYGRKFQNHRDVTWVAKKNVQRKVPAAIDLGAITNSANGATDIELRALGINI